MKPKIVFTGSSIIALWDSLPQFFPEFHIINTGISGACTSDIFKRIDELVIAHHPTATCYYCGSNDINCNLAESTILETTTNTFHSILANSPCLCIYLSIIKAPQKRDRWRMVDDINSRMKGFCESTPGMRYLDVNQVFFSSNGEPRTDLYVEDQLHYTPAGYGALGAYAAPKIASLLKGASQQ